ncbi:MAG: Thioredoxin family protein [uncultured Thiotrichaceae bacterium]|uniref:Thioredoxin family protein n=1 Tax=uncultured Thiotrichaceae bacterium TaxID=298394 RepID=A0A6S6T1V4_9GAMM|nr:MAG: Thioredoxin family protein [uncultured Thiotrichaceae bacterium]
MAKTSSTMLELGISAPDFTLVEPLTGKAVSKNDFTGQPLLVAFICNHCPYVVHIREAFNAFVSDYQGQGLQCVAINSNDVENYPDDSPEKMMVDTTQYRFPFVYLYDETQEVAKAYQAACTPDFFLFDSEHVLYYRGQFDDSRPGNDAAVSGKDLRNAADYLLAGKDAPEKQFASLGCNIKWKVGNEPEYFG